MQSIKPTESKESKTALTPKNTAAPKSMHDPVLIKELSDLAGIPLPEVPLNALFVIQINNKDQIVNLLSYLAGYNPARKIYKHALSHLLRRHDLILNSQHINLFTAAFIENNVEVIRHLQAHGVQMNFHQNHLSACFATFVATQPDNKSDLTAKAQTLKLLLSTPNKMKPLRPTVAPALAHICSLPEEIQLHFLPLMYQMIKAEGLIHIRYGVIKNSQDLKEFLQRYIGGTPDSEEKDSAQPTNQMKLYNKMSDHIHQHCHEPLATWLESKNTDSTVTPDPAINAIINAHQDNFPLHFKKLSHHIITEDNPYLLQATLNMPFFLVYEIENHTLLNLAISQGKLGIIYQLIVHLTYNKEKIFQRALDAKNYKDPNHLFGVVNTLLSNSIFLANIKMEDLIKAYLQSQTTNPDLAVVLLRKIRIKINELVSKDQHEFKVDFSERSACDLRYAKLLPDIVKKDPTLNALLLQWCFQAAIDHHLPAVLENPVHCQLSDLRSIAEYHTEMGTSEEMVDKTIYHLNRAEQAYTALCNLGGKDRFYYDQMQQIYNHLVMLPHLSGITQLNLIVLILYRIDNSNLYSITLPTINFVLLLEQCNSPADIKDIATQAKLRLPKINSATSIIILGMELQFWQYLKTFDLEDATIHTVYIRMLLANALALQGDKITAQTNRFIMINDCLDYFKKTKKISSPMLNYFNHANENIISNLLKSWEFEVAKQTVNEMQEHYEAHLKVTRNPVEIHLINSLKDIAQLFELIVSLQAGIAKEKADKILSLMRKIRIRFEKLFLLTDNHIEPMVIYLDTLGDVIDDMWIRFKTTNMEYLLSELDKLRKVIVAFTLHALSPEINVRAIFAFEACINHTLSLLKCIEPDNPQILQTAYDEFFTDKPIEIFAQTRILRKFIIDACDISFKLLQYDKAIYYAKCLVEGYAHNKQPADESAFATAVGNLGYYYHQKALIKTLSVDERLQALNDARATFLKIVCNPFESNKSQRYLAHICFLKAELLFLHKPENRQESQLFFTLAETQLQKLSSLNDHERGMLSNCQQYLKIFEPSLPAVKPQMPAPKLSDVKTEEPPVPPREKTQKRAPLPTFLPLNMEAHKLTMQFTTIQATMRAYFQTTTHLELHAERKRYYDAALKEVLNDYKEDGKTKKTKAETDEQITAFCSSMNTLYKDLIEHDDKHSTIARSKKLKPAKSTLVADNHPADKSAKKAKKKGNKNATNHRPERVSAKLKKQQKRAGNASKSIVVPKSKEPEPFTYRFVGSSQAPGRPAESKRSTLQHSLPTPDTQPSPVPTEEQLTTQSRLEAMRNSADEKSSLAQDSSANQMEDPFEPGMSADMLTSMRMLNVATQSLFSPPPPREDKRDASQGISAVSASLSNAITSVGLSLTRKTENVGD